jgi:hypothetical protein
LTGQPIEKGRMFWSQNYRVGHILTTLLYFALALYFSHKQGGTNSGVADLELGDLHLDVGARRDPLGDLLYLKPSFSKVDSHGGHHADV